MSAAVEHILENRIRRLKDLKLGDILVQQGIVSQAQVDKALDRKRVHASDQRIGEILVSMGYLSEQDIRIALAKKLGIPVVELDKLNINKEIIKEVPSRIISQYRILPVAISGNRMFVAMEDPLNLRALEVLHFYSKYDVEPVLVTVADMDEALRRFSVVLQSDEADQVLEAFEGEGLEDYIDTKGQNQDDGERDLAREANEKPIVKLLNATLYQAIQHMASDMSFRPQQDNAEIHIRVDGRYRLLRTVPKGLLPALVSRLKIISRLDIASRLMPQDGHAQIKLEGRRIDLRVSILPTIYGESASIRILDKKVGFRPLPEIGFVGQDLKTMRQLLTRSFGILLVTGPTGSGKTTTMYAMLDEIKRKEPHVITIEEPVEYQMEGIEQIAVRNNIGLTFARALRNTLRHDPDVIMVGEIRDGETAQIANQAALTGHLVLSTLHTNDAASATTRLLDIGIEPFLLGSTMLGVIAQRLIPLNCPHCLADEEPDEALLELMGVSKSERFKKSTGCNKCEFTGVKGRTIVYEVLSVNARMREMIHQKQDAYLIKEAAIENGMVPLTQRALMLARKGQVSFETAATVYLD